MDADLFRFDRIRAPAGGPFSLFAIEAAGCATPAGRR